MANHVADTYREPGAVMVKADEQAVLNAIATASAVLDETNLRSEAVAKEHLTDSGSLPPTHGPFYRTQIVLTAPAQYAHSNTTQQVIAIGSNLVATPGTPPTMGRYDVLRYHVNVFVRDLTFNSTNDNSWFSVRITYNNGASNNVYTIERRIGHGDMDSAVYTTVGDTIEWIKVSLSGLWFNPTSGDVTIEDVQVHFRTEHASNAIGLSTSSLFWFLARN